MNEKIKKVKKNPFEPILVFPKKIDKKKKEQALLYCYSLLFNDLESIKIQKDQTGTF